MNLTLNFRGDEIPSHLLEKMTLEDPVAQLMKDGKEKLSTSTQKALLTQLSSKFLIFKISRNFRNNNFIIYSLF